jgi:hypothetical protein
MSPKPARRKRSRWAAFGGLLGLGGRLGDLYGHREPNLERRVTEHELHCGQRVCESYQFALGGAS